MPFQVNRTLPLKAMIFGQPLNVEIRLASQNQAFFDEVQRRAKQEAEIDRQVKDGEIEPPEQSNLGAFVIWYLVKVLESWDATDGGTPIPLTEEGLKTVPVPILTQLQQQIQSFLFQGKATNSK
jgi:hypothetical protein